MAALGVTASQVTRGGGAGATGAASGGGCGAVATEVATPAGAGGFADAAALVWAGGLADEAGLSPNSLRKKFMKEWCVTKRQHLVFARVPAQGQPPKDRKR